MEQIITGLIEKVGLSESQAQAVIAFLREHVDELPALLAKGDLAASVPGMLGGLVGGDDADTAPQIISSFLR